MEFLNLLLPRFIQRTKGHKGHIIGSYPPQMATARNGIIAITIALAKRFVWIMIIPAWFMFLMNRDMEMIDLGAYYLIMRGRL